MDDISGALVGIALALAAVFLPMAFFGGSTGVIYRQFSVTIVSAMALSVLVALIFTPALCATLLKPADTATDKPPHRITTLFNKGFDSTRARYLAGTSWMIGHRLWSGLSFALITAIAVVYFIRLPTGFLPPEDQGLLFGQVTLPAGATSAQTAALNRQIAAYLLTHEKASVDSVFSATGFSFGGEAENVGFVVAKLKDWSERTQSSRAVAAIASRTMQHFASDRAASIVMIQPPPVMELGNATGFDLELEDTGQLDHADFLAARNQFLMAASQDKLLAAVYPNGLEDAPQYQLTVDREKASALGISIADVDATIEGALASEYVDQFMRNGRVKQVYVQGEPSSRMQPADLSRWYVRNAAGDMVPFDAFLTSSWTLGPQKVENYNELTSFEIEGSPAPGVSSGTAMAEVEKLAAQLPPGVSYEWTGLSYEQVKSGSQTYLLYGISLLVILLCLAALFGSWSVPAAVLLVVPLGLIGAILATSLRGLDNDVYFQVGLLTTMGLAAKNAILIVQFAKGFFDGGMPLAQAAMQAAKERLRPILMTSIAFILGVVPLAIASGAGAGARIAIGTAVVGGMFSATVLAIFFVPAFFTNVLGLFRVKPHQIPAPSAPLAAPPAAPPAVKAA
jgi:multidrug efflux pump